MVYKFAWHGIELSPGTVKPMLMKVMTEWLETVIEKVNQPKSSSVVLLVLIVLILGAGSLYMLLNTGG
jgi:hypothetical protein